MKATCLRKISFVSAGMFIFLFPLDKIVAQTGPYLGQEPPGFTPELFAPEIFPRALELHSPTLFSHEGTEVYYSPMDGPPNEIMYMHMETDGSWTQPQLVPFSSEYGSGDPTFSPNGERLYFLSWHPLIEGGPTDKENIWYVQRQGDSWSEPQPVGDEVNRYSVHWEVSVDSEYNLYFGGSPLGQEEWDIYCSEYVDGGYVTPIRLSDAINTELYESTPFIAPDGSYLIFNRVNISQGGYADLYISFKKEDGTWSTARNVGETINTNLHELYPVVTVDGRYLFFLSNRDYVSRTYWVDAQVLSDDFRCQNADCNEDGSVDILDALWEVNCILGTAQTPCGCDYNQDGKSDILDVLGIINIILEGSCL